MLNEYDCVRLVKPLVGEQVPVGSKGVILMVHCEPRLAYEVEFFDEAGKTIGASLSFTVEPDQIETIEK